MAEDQQFTSLEGIDSLTISGITRQFDRVLSGEVTEAKGHRQEYVLPINAIVETDDPIARIHRSAYISKSNGPVRIQLVNPATQTEISIISNADDLAQGYWSTGTIVVGGDILPFSLQKDAKGARFVTATAPSNLGEINDDEVIMRLTELKQQHEQALLSRFLTNPTEFFNTLGVENCAAIPSRLSNNAEAIALVERMDELRQEQNRVQPDEQNASTIRQIGPITRIITIRARHDNVIEGINPSGLTMTFTERDSRDRRSMRTVHHTLMQVTSGRRTLGYTVFSFVDGQNSEDHISAREFISAQEDLLFLHQ